MKIIQPKTQNVFTVNNHVTGEQGYQCYNSLGDSYITDEKRPYCRDINTDGQCPYYKPKALGALKRLFTRK